MNTCLWCHREIEKRDKYCSLECRYDFESFGDMDYSPEIIYENDTKEDIYKKIKSLDYND